MTHRIIETWRPLTEEDRIKPSYWKTEGSYVEGYVQKLEENLELFYIRNRECKMMVAIDKEGNEEEIKFDSEIFSKFAKFSPDRKKPLLMFQMAYGGIAENSFAYEFTQGINLERYLKGELPGYTDWLLSIIEEKALLNLFGKIPTNNEYYKKELETLDMLFSLENKLKSKEANRTDLERLLGKCETKIIGMIYKNS